MRGPVLSRSERSLKATCVQNFNRGVNQEGQLDRNSESAGSSKFSDLPDHFLLMRHAH